MSEIYLHLDGQQKGPYSEAEVRNQVASGLSADTPAWHAGLSEWSTVAALGLFASSVPPVPPPVVPATPPLPQVRSGSSKGIPGCWLAAMIVAVLSVFVIPCLLGPITPSLKKARESATMQTARAIDLAMYSYAADHNGAYPDGRTSTEVFQKLLDGKYVDDPTIFYLNMPGKIRPTSNQLSADNVCYDVTSGITADSPDDVPVVFSEGYDITYSAGTAATPARETTSLFSGMAVAYKNNSVRFCVARADGTVPEVVPNTFLPGKGTYRQLKP